jgi:hypothetical protein
VRIAKVKSRCIRVIPKGARSPYFFLEWLDAFMDAELLQQKAWINEIAKELRSSATLPSVASLSTQKTFGWLRLNKYSTILKAASRTAFNLHQTCR